MESIAPRNFYTQRPFSNNEDLDTHTAQTTFHQCLVGLTLVKWVFVEETCVGKFSEGDGAFKTTLLTANATAHRVPLHWIWPRIKIRDRVVGLEHVQVVEKMREREREDPPPL